MNFVTQNGLKWSKLSLLLTNRSVHAIRNRQGRLCRWIMRKESPAETNKNQVSKFVPDETIDRNLDYSQIDGIYNFTNFVDGKMQPHDEESDKNKETEESVNFANSVLCV